jgi:hypothetical protein
MNTNKQKSASLGDIGKYRTELFQKLTLEDMTYDDLHP